MGMFLGTGGWGARTVIGTTFELFCAGSLTFAAVMGPFPCSIGSTKQKGHHPVWGDGPLSNPCSLRFGYITRWLSAH
jgi:hypothetical protein